MMQDDDFVDEFMEYDLAMGAEVVTCPHCGVDVHEEPLGFRKKHLVEELDLLVTVVQAVLEGSGEELRQLQTPGLVRLLELTPEIVLRGHRDLALGRQAEVEEAHRGALPRRARSALWSGRSRGVRSA